MTPSTEWCAVIQSLVWSRWASASSSGFPEISGLEWDQFKYTICCSCCADGACGAAGSAAGGGGLGCGTSWGCGPGSAISYAYLAYIRF